MKLYRLLQHTMFVLTSRSLYLPSISRAIMGFKGDRHHRHHISCDVHVDLLLWTAILSGEHIAHSLLPPMHLDPDMWVDASTSWGIGMVVKGQWAAWQLLDGWNEA